MEAGTGPIRASRKPKGVAANREAADASAANVLPIVSEIQAAAATASRNRQGVLHVLHRSFSSVSGCSVEALEQRLPFALQNGFFELANFRSDGECLCKARSNDRYSPR